MEMQTIGQISKKYGISIQTLRYYEQAGLIQSMRNGDNAYRFYDEAAIKQIHSIIFLRKLRISLKQIKEILDNQDVAATVEIFEQNISELDEEITSLSTIKSILARFAEELRAKADMALQLDLLSDTLSIVNSLSFSKNHINNSIKENFTMEDLNKAHETLSKLKRIDGQVRIIYVPPMTVATHGVLSEEEKKIAEKFMQESGFLKIKPDVRVFAVFHCSIEDLKFEEPPHEGWASIPDDMELPAPLTKKTFEGGLYAAYAGRESLDSFRALAEWVNESEEFEIADDGRPLLDECLDAYHLIKGELKQGTGKLQGDLLIPINRITE